MSSHSSLAEDYIFISNNLTIETDVASPTSALDSSISENYSWICGIEWTGESVTHIKDGLDFMVKNVPNLEKMDFFYSILYRILHQTRNDIGTRQRILEPVYRYFEQNKTVNWPFVLCNGCRKSGLQVLRYKCSVCDDFDLCQECFYKPPTEDIEKHIKRNDSASANPFCHKFICLSRPEKDTWTLDRCNECFKKGFDGLKWSCTECPEYCLCQACYNLVSSDYSHMHQFKCQIPHTELAMSRMN